MDDFDKTIAPHRSYDYVQDDLTMPGRRDRKNDGRFTVGDLILNRYKVLALLGQGGMGVVYKCFDEIAGVEIALKALPPELSHNTLEMEDIKDNFQLVHNLHHPKIAASNNLERDNSNGNYYLIMECVSGEDLRRWIRRRRQEGNFSFEKTLDIIKQVASALDYAHQQRVIHRDIKPGNIMISADGNIKVLDFGLAAQIHTSMTRVSMAYHGTSGTGPYMAPEQWRGRPQGAAADQYALAVMTYEMLAGFLPFESTDAAVLQQAVLTQEADEIAHIPKYAQLAIKRAMSKNPSERFESCSDFVAALSGQKLKTATTRKNNRIWLITGVIALLLCAGGIGYWFVDKQQKERAEKLAAEKAAKERIAELEQRKREEIAQLREEEERLAKIAAEQKRLKLEEENKKASERLAKERAEKLAAEKAAKERIAELEQRKREETAQLRAEEERLAKIAAEQKRLEQLKRTQDEFAQQQQEWTKSANSAFRQQNYSSALSFLKKLQSPSPENYYQMAVCYQKVGNSYMAEEYFKRAKGTGYYDKDCNLGAIFSQNGQWKQATSYYEDVLKHDPDNNTALLRLAVIYLYGRDGQNNSALGKKYLEQAAKNGDPKAMFNLGCCYAKFNGLNFPVFSFSRPLAVRWLRKAKEKGISLAEEKLRELGE